MLVVLQAKLLRVVSLAGKTITLGDKSSEEAMEIAGKGGYELAEFSTALFSLLETSVANRDQVFRRAKLLFLRGPPVLCNSVFIISHRLSQQD